MQIDLRPKHPIGKPSMSGAPPVGDFEGLMEGVDPSSAISRAKGSGISYHYRYKGFRVVEYYTIVCVQTPGIGAYVYCKEDIIDEMRESRMPDCEINDLRSDIVDIYKVQWDTVIYKNVPLAGVTPREDLITVRYAVTTMANAVRDALSYWETYMEQEPY